MQGQSFWKVRSHAHRSQSLPGAALNDINSGLVDATVATVNGTLRLSSPEQLFTLNGSGSVALAGNRLTVSNGAFSGVISGTEGLTKISSGVLSLSGASTYTGSTLINAGTLALSGSLVSDVVTVATGATLTNTSGGLSSAAALTNNGTVNQDSNDTVATLLNTGTINNGGFRLTATTYALNNGSVVNANLGTGIVNASGTVALNGTSSAETFNVLTGTTTLGSAERLLDTTDWTITSGATLKLGGLEKIGSLFGAGSLNNMGFCLTADDGTFSGVISGSGGLTKVSTGLLTLSGANTYTGTTLVDAGTLGLTGSLASTSVTIASGATLNDVNSGLVDATVATVNGTLALSAPEQILTLNGSGLVSLAANRLTVSDGTFSGVISGTAGITKISSGVLNLSGASTYTGSTLINVGTLSLSGSLASTTVTVASGATLTNTAGGLAVASTLTNNGTVNQNSNDTIAVLVNTGIINGSPTLTATTYALNSGSVINANLGAGTVNANGTVALNGTSSASIFNVISGTTTLGSAERLLDTIDLTINSGATLKLGGAEKIGSLLGAGSLNNMGFRLTADDGTFSGVISGSGGLTKVTTGVFSLTGANTYTGTTLINAGTLTGSGSLTSNVTIASGATAMGTLTINGNFQNNGTFAPGNSPGLTTILGNYTESGTLQTELGSTTPINGHDQVRVGGSVTLTSGYSLVVQSPRRSSNHLRTLRNSLLSITELSPTTRSPTNVTSTTCYVVVSAYYLTCLAKTPKALPPILESISITSRRVMKLTSTVQTSMSVVIM